ncbi:peptidoglycan DD-metalloendopeptidase family protein [Desulfonatronum lacustre]|uniref:peptidoglycan DD-metalloendopeptidase family protein n=1 Tax=Desulfonatronum lacustre TaxID=66849 RepID=UPI0004AD9711|nr:peptidoglycan DD-metalloendopeptidase family protein [Desulfonatronum lacustre]
MIGLPDTNTLLLGHGQNDVHRRFDALRGLRSGESTEDSQRTSQKGDPQDAATAKHESKLREASQDFEAMFLHQLIKQMRATVPHHDPLRGKGEEFWQSHFDMEMASVLARSGGMGLGDMIFEQLRQTQVQATKDSDPVGKPMPLTILAPPQKPTLAADATASETDPEPSLSATYPQVASLQGPFAAPEATGRPQGSSFDAVSIPGTTSTMNMVRSLARSIEERGGVVPEHPGSVNGPSRTGSVDGPSLTGNIDSPSPILPPMHWPLEGRVSSGFGWRQDPFTGEQAWHSGVDMAASKGTPIGAAWDGRVVFVGQRGGYGNMVVLEHAGGWRSYYAHNDRNTVKVGDKIQAGQQIATVGSTGRSTGPHLHFEVRQGTTAWNPKQIQDRLEAGLHIGKQDSA